MKKRILLILIFLVSLSILIGCEKKSIYEKHTDSFFDTFDTITQIVAYTESKEEFDTYIDIMHNRFLELHQLFDKYNNYEGVNNIKTINDNAGIAPVKVDKEIIDMLLFSKEWYEKAGEETNIAFGPVIKIWSQYRDIAEANPADAQLPPMEDLKNANRFTDMDKVIIDEKNSTVYLEELHMSLDVGAVAKGYATEIVAREIQSHGLTSGIISAGGNIRTIGKPLDALRERWGVGIQNPDLSVSANSNILDTVFINDASVVSSGDYQRFYMVGDKVIHHIIDPKTLMPADYFHAVTIITPDAGLADFLSTAVFLLPYEEGRKLVESLDDVEAIWVVKDGTIEATEGMKKMMKSQGATGAKAK